MVDQNLEWGAENSSVSRGLGGAIIVDWICADHVPINASKRVVLRWRNNVSKREAPSCVGNNRENLYNTYPNAS